MYISKSNILIIYGLRCRVQGIVKMDKKFSAADEKYMDTALELARKAKNPSPNPYVGAVLVRNGRVVGQGYHKFAGASHAEVNAIKNSGKRLYGSTLYINLEPCSHYGRTPPCTDTIIRAGIKKVFIAMKDPNPLVNGKGVKALQGKGVAVRTGLKEEESKKLNEFYVKFIMKKMPFVILKAAISLDGKIATSKGESKWISGEVSRKYVHKVRSKVDAILVGIGTVLKDDPELNTGTKAQRHSEGVRMTLLSPSDKGTKFPYKVIVDSRLRIPLKAKVLKNPELVVIAATKDAPRKKIEYLEKLGVKVLIINKKDGKVDLKVLMKRLAGMEISSVLIEGGGEISAGAISSGIVDKIIFFIAPKIIGGRSAKTSIEGEGIKRLQDFIKIREMKFKAIGPDIMVEGYL